MTMPAPQPPAGPPPTGDPSATPPPVAPPAVPAAPAAPYGTPPHASPQHPLPPGAPPAAPPYLPQYPAAPAMPAGAPSWPSASPAPTPGDDDGGYDLSRLPRAAREEISRLREQVQRSTTELRTAQVSQQAHAIAAQSGVNPAALLGSTAWAQAVSQLDPAAPDFGQRLAWTVQAVAQANPWMAAQAAPAPSTTPPAPAAPPASGADFAGAAGGTAPITEADLAHMSPQQIDEAWRAGRLKHLM